MLCAPPGRDTLLAYHQGEGSLLRESRQQRGFPSAWAGRRIPEDLQEAGGLLGGRVFLQRLQNVSVNQSTISESASFFRVRLTCLFEEINFSVLGQFTGGRSGEGTTCAGARAAFSAKSLSSSSYFSSQGQRPRPAQSAVGMCGALEVSTAGKPQALSSAVN